MKHKFITIGEIMLRLTPPNYEKIRTATSFEARYGGSEANVALSLANLGVDASFFTVVPGNSLGKSAVRMLRSNDVNCDNVVIQQKKRHRHIGLEPIIWRRVTESARVKSFMTENTVLFQSMISAKQM